MNGSLDVHSISIIAMILAAAVLSLELCISVAILEILAGVIASQFLMDPNAEYVWMDFLANLGLIGLMFFAGFETDEQLLRRYWKQSTFIGTLSYFAPFALVFLVAYFGFGIGLRASLLIGIGLSTTSLALVYSTLRERDSVEARWGQTLLSSAMVVDVLSMLSLTFVFEGMSPWALILFVPMLASMLALPRIGRWVFSRYHGDRVEFKTRFVLVVLLGLVLVADTVGLHVALLAFVTGILFSEMMEEHVILEEKLRSLIFGFMAPLFFFQAGASIDFADMNGRTIALIVALGSVAFLGKYVATYFSIRRYLRAAVARFAGLVFNYRLSFGIIVASFGMHEGLISPSIYAAMLTIILVAVIISSILMRAIPHEV